MDDRESGLVRKPTALPKKTARFDDEEDDDGDSSVNANVTFAGMSCIIGCCIHERCC